MAHWKKFFHPDFLGAYAIEDGEDLVVTIDHAGEETFTGNQGKKETGLVIHFKEHDIKPMICNATNAKAITKVAGSPDTDNWPGTVIALYSAEVSAFGETTEGLRVRPFAPKRETFVCQDCGKEISGYKNYSARQMAEKAKSKHGRYLCMECAKKATDAAEKEKQEGDILSDESNED